VGLQKYRQTQGCIRASEVSIILVMAIKTLPGGTVHKLPADFKKMITSNRKTLALWEDITPLARNEWICWIDSAKQEGTRLRRIQVGKSKMLSGERRPCCWVGCIHRKDKAISPSVQWVLSRQSKS
jgi:hypothetical protein